MFYQEQGGKVNSNMLNNENTRRLNIFTDGACSGNGTPNARAGWGIIVCDENFNVETTEKGKVTGKQTNNRAELTAVYFAFKYIDQRADSISEVNIYIDSEITAKGIRGECERKANRDIWQEIEAICDKLAMNIKININQVEGHSTDKENIIANLNNQCDYLAKCAGRALV